MKKNIAIIGEGAWGTAVATLLAANGHQVFLWCHDEAVKESIERTRENGRYLPGITLPSSIVPTMSMEEALCDAEWVFEAIPVKFLRSVLVTAKPFYKPKQIWVILSKGIEDGTLNFPSQILDECFQAEVQKAAVLGPSYARDLAQKQYTGITVAALDCQIAYQCQEILANEYCRPYASLDMAGVQMNAAVKNVLALGIGMLEGAGYGDNTRCFMLARGLHEMVLLAQAVGGKAETVYGLSGVGDLVLTAMGGLSRNKETGQRLGRGESLDAILAKTGYTPEGINTLQSIHALAQRYHLALPILQGIYECVIKGQSLDDFLKKLMACSFEDECGY